MEMASAMTNSTSPKPMMTPWSMAMPMSVRAAVATPTENGFTVEPMQPAPAPSSTTSAPVSVSKPAAYMVAASRM